jgi:hypothetical protein
MLRKRRLAVKMSPVAKCQKQTTAARQRPAYSITSSGMASTTSRGLGPVAS